MPVYVVLRIHLLCNMVSVIIINVYHWLISVKDPLDYQGRSFLHIPQDVGVNLKSEEPPDRCFLPKKHIHTWTGHSKGIAAIRWFPVSAHLLLSCSMDSKIKVIIMHNVFGITSLHHILTVIPMNIGILIWFEPWLGDLHYSAQNSVNKVHSDLTWK